MCACAILSTHATFSRPPAFRLTDWSIVGFLGVALMTAGARMLQSTSRVSPLLAFYLSGLSHCGCSGISERLELSRWVGGASATLALVWMMEVLKRGGEGGLAAELSGYTLSVLVLTYLLTAELKPSRLRSDVPVMALCRNVSRRGPGGPVCQLSRTQDLDVAFEFHLAALSIVLWLGWRSQSRRFRDSRSAE